MAVDNFARLLAAGKVGLEEDGKISPDVLPSYVDDIEDLLVVSSEAPTEFEEGDKYYNTVDKLIYTATSDSTWDDGEVPVSGKIYINTSTNPSRSLRWDGEDLVEIGVDMSNYLAKDNTEVFTPSGNYNPSTKKYVDDIAETKQNVLAYEEMPSVNNFEVGEIVLYVGEGNKTYANGHFYIVKEENEEKSWSVLRPEGKTYHAGILNAYVTNDQATRDAFTYAVKNGYTTIMYDTTGGGTIFSCRCNLQSVPITGNYNFNFNGILINNWLINNVQTSIQFQNGVCTSIGSAVLSNLANQYVNISTPGYNQGKIQHVRNVNGSIQWVNGEPIVNDVVRQYNALPLADNSNLGSVVQYSGNTIDLPSIYQGVTYVKSSGSQYINTGIDASNIGRIVTDFKTDTIRNYNWAMGANNHVQSSGAECLGIGLSSAENKNGLLKGGAGNKIAYTFIDNTLYNIDYKISSTFIEGMINGDYTKANNNGTVGSQNLYLYGLNYAGQVKTGELVTLYLGRVEIYGLDQITLLGDFIPCYRKSDSVAGFYDTVSENFFTATSLVAIGSVPNLITGHFYKCVMNEGDPITYSWEEVRIGDKIYTLDITGIYQATEQIFYNEGQSPNQWFYYNLTEANQPILWQQLNEIKEAYDKGERPIVYLNTWGRQSNTRDYSHFTRSIFTFPMNYGKYVGQQPILIGQTPLRQTTSIWPNSVIETFQIPLAISQNQRQITVVGFLTTKSPVMYDEVLPKVNTKEYTPTADYNPATKKYVDDSIVAASTQYETMPNATADTLGEVIQYIGTTTQDYTQGYFYVGSSKQEEVSGATVTVYYWDQVEFAAALTYAEESDINDIFGQNSPGVTTMATLSGLTDLDGTETGIIEGDTGSERIINALEGLTTLEG